MYKLSPLDISPHNVIDASEVAIMFNTTKECVAHPKSRYRHCYLGNSIFIRNEIEEIRYTDSMNEWFKAEMGLFIAYLMEIKNITGSSIAKAVGVAPTNICRLQVSLKIGAKILVKYNKYIKDFEEYYYGL